MNTISNGVYQPAQRLHPLSLLTQHVSHDADGCLQISSSGSAWFLYLEQGKLVYASDLTDPFGRLDRHLRLLSIQSPSLVSAVRVQVRLMFEEMPTADQPSRNSDYRAICWLVEQQHLSPEQAATLIEAMAREVIGAFLPIQMGSHELIEQDLLANLPRFCQIDLREIAESCQVQFQRRQSALPNYSQPPDRASSHGSSRLRSVQANSEFYAERYGTEPDSQSESRYSGYSSRYIYEDGSRYLPEPPVQPVSEPLEHSYQPGAELERPLEQPDELAGRSARRLDAFEHLAPQIEPAIRLENHTAAAADQSELEIHSSPPSHLDSYPQTASPSIPPLAPDWPAVVKPLTPQWFTNHVQSASRPVAEVNTKKYTIACIDDSPTVLQAINSFLDDKSFSVVLISDPIKALMQIIRSRPDLILLDVTMPNLDGYELCSLLRKHPSFRGTPIVMVTGNTGFIDRAKAKLVGSSGYLTKPFTQADLIKIVFKHLS